MSVDPLKIKCVVKLGNNTYITDGYGDYVNENGYSIVENIMRAKVFPTRKSAKRFIGTLGKKIFGAEIIELSDSQIAEREKIDARNQMAKAIQMQKYLAEMQKK